MPRRRLLLVEDEPGLVMTLTDRLIAEGYEVATATDAGSGLEAATSGHFDAILLDVMLPGGSGLDVCRTLRQREVRTPVLMLTARWQVGDRVVGLKLGADDYLVKPFDMAELLARVEALLRRGGKATPPAAVSEVLRFGDVTVDVRKAEVTKRGRRLELSAREFKLLCYFLEHRGPCSRETSCSTRSGATSRCRPPGPWMSMWRGSDRRWRIIRDIPCTCSRSTAWGTSSPSRGRRAGADSRETRTGHQKRPHAASWIARSRRGRPDRRGTRFARPASQELQTMEINRSSVALLAALSLTAGAAGAYLVTRGAPGQNTVSAGNEVHLDDPSPVASRLPATGVGSQIPPTPADRQRTARMLRPQASRPVEPAPDPIAQAPQELPPPAPQASVEAVTATVPSEPVHLDDPVAPVAEVVGPEYDELAIAADSVVGLEMETSVSSEAARVEDAVRGRVARDVRVGNRVAIPAGSRADGEVVLVERGGRLRERARLGVQFTSITTPDGTRLPIHTAMIYREGSSPGVASASKIGGAALGGAIIGGILGGGKGAALGGSVGAGAGSAAVLAGGRSPATLSSGTLVTVRLEESVVVTVER